MFVNPLVAVILGWLFFREPFGIRESVAMLVIFAGVAVVRWSMSSARNPQSILAPEEIGALPE
jgi:EamA domain-containing membrane protein RarD